MTDQPAMTPTELERRVADLERTSPADGARARTGLQRMRRAGLITGGLIAAGVLTDQVAGWGLSDVGLEFITDGLGDASGRVGQEAVQAAAEASAEGWYAWVENSGLFLARALDGLGLSGLADMITGAVNWGAQFQEGQQQIYGRDANGVIMPLRTEDYTTATVPDADTVVPDGPAGIIPATPDMNVGDAFHAREFRDAFATSSGMHGRDVTNVADFRAAFTEAALASGNEGLLDEFNAIMEADEITSVFNSLPGMTADLAASIGSNIQLFHQGYVPQESIAQTAGVVANQLTLAATPS